MSRMVKKTIELDQDFIDKLRMIFRVRTDKEAVNKFANDVQVAFAALSIGALLYTEDKDRFEIIRDGVKALKVQYV